MTKKELAYIKTWLEIASHDLAAAQMVFEYNPLILDIACFHCQQAIEKYFKAFLIFKKKDFDKTHDVLRLKNQCAKIDKNFVDINLKNLSDYAVGVRYPDDYIMPSLKEAKEYLQMVLDVQELVLEKIKF